MIVYKNSNRVFYNSLEVYNNSNVVSALIHVPNEQPNDGGVIIQIPEDEAATMYLDRLVQFECIETENILYIYAIVQN